jgi:beta-lactamase regulating signal transducer with metallopeptidase domain
MTIEMKSRRYNVSSAHRQPQHRLKSIVMAMMMVILMVILITIML